MHGPVRTQCCGRGLLVAALAGQLLLRSIFNDTRAGCRSPAEGAYSEGFISSKLNQDYCIECPGTGSTFDFRTGEIKEWYPSNFVLRVLTPKGTCRNLETYPVRLEQV